MYIAKEHVLYRSAQLVRIQFALDRATIYTDCQVDPNGTL